MADRTIKSLSKCFDGCLTTGSTNSRIFFGGNIPNISKVGPEQSEFLGKILFAPLSFR